MEFEFKSNEFNSTQMRSAWGSTQAGLALRDVLSTQHPQTWRRRAGPASCHPRRLLRGRRVGTLRMAAEPLSGGPGTWGVFLAPSLPLFISLPPEPDAEEFLTLTPPVSSLTSPLPVPAGQLMAARWALAAKGSRTLRLPRSRARSGPSAGGRSCPASEQAPSVCPSVCRA